MKIFYTKKWILVFAGTLLFIYSTICVGQVNTDESYLGQNPPGNEPEIFAPGIISLDNRLETYPTFSPDGKEMFFTVVNSSWTTGEIFHTQEQNGNWNEPDTASFSANDYINWESFISPDGNRQFFSSNHPPSVDMDIWMVEKLTDTSWSDPVQLNDPVNSSAVDGSPCVTHSNSIYFKSKRGGGIGGSWLYKAELIDSIYSQVENLGGVINTGSGESEPYIAPDESYLIFISKTRTGGKGGWDLWISYHNNDDSWTEPVNMGSDINTAMDEYGPRVTHDGKYLFFTRDNGSSKMDIYWASAGIIDTLKSHLTPSMINLTYTGNLQIFPNPSNGIVNISMDDISGKTAEVEVVNNLGKHILANTFQNTTTIDLSDYPKGIYIVRILINGQVINKKICLE